MDTETGDCGEQRLEHCEGAQEFYRDLATQGKKVRVGMEASGHARWFERLLAELNIELWRGDAAVIRAKRGRKKKTDREDARHILNLLLTGDFPQIWVASWENRDLRQLLWRRHRMVQARTRVMNQLRCFINHRIVSAVAPGPVIQNCIADCGAETGSTCHRGISGYLSKETVATPPEVYSTNCISANALPIRTDGRLPSTDLQAAEVSNPDVQPESPTSPMLRFLLGAACTVIILAGVRAAAPVLGPLLLSLLVAYALVPFPRWLIRRFKFPKGVAIAMTAGAIVAVGLFLAFSLNLAGVRIEEKLPIYEQRLTSVYDQGETFTSAHGFSVPIHSVRSLLTPAQLRVITSVVLAMVRSTISEILLSSLLAFLFIMEMADTGTKRSALAERLAFYRSDAEIYVAVTARSAGIKPVRCVAA